MVALFSFRAIVDQRFFAGTFASFALVPFLEGGIGFSCTRGPVLGATFASALGGSMGNKPWISASIELMMLPRSSGLLWKELSSTSITSSLPLSYFSIQPS